MAVKRKTPVFSAIVLRVLSLRFQEILRVQLVTQTEFDVVIASKADVDALIAIFDNYMVHLASEFADPELTYQFRFYQSTKLKGELKYHATA